MSSLHRRLAHRRRLLIKAKEALPDLWYDFRKVSSAVIDDGTRIGPDLTFTRASDGSVWDETGTLITDKGTDVPRFDHDPANSNASLGLVMEEAQTNELLQSEDMGTTWTNNSVALTTNTDVAPDGNTTADTIEDDDTGSFDSIQQDVSGVSNSDQYCLSVYVLKDAVAKTTRFPNFRITWTGGTQSVIDFTLDTSTGETNSKVSSGSATADDVGTIDAGDYWRMYGVSTNDASGNTTAQILAYPAVGANSDLSTFSSTALGTITVWGWQFELGDKPSSYMPTTTSAVTRALELCQSSDVGWHNSGGPGTWFAQFDQPFLDPAQFVFTADDNSANDREAIDVDNSSQPRALAETTVGDDGSTTSASAIVAGVTQKVAFAYDTDDMAMSHNGATVVTDATVDFPADNATNLRIGHRNANVQQINGHIQVIKYRGARKSNAFLESETE